MQNLLEDPVEKYLDKQVKKRGGFTVKLSPVNNVGIPDRLVVLPDRIIFCELKRPRGGVVAKLQAWWNARFTKLGHEARFAKSHAEVDAMLDEVPERR